MNYCEACKEKEAKYHATLRLTLVGPEGAKTKIVQFWLCESCEAASQQVLARDRMQRERLARRLSEGPDYLTKWQDWRLRNQNAWRRMLQETEQWR